jgi:outer membrane autotransporter protein
LIGDVHAEGDTGHVGGGLLIRHDFDLGIYAEGSVRAGKVTQDFSTSDLYGPRDTYEADSSYWGGHAGLGYKTDILGSEDALDIYSKILFTRQSGQELVNSALETLSFDSVESIRTRVGMKVSHQLNSVVRGYAGAAYEHEFDSELKSRINGVEIKPLDMQGDSYLSEVGVKLRPMPTGPLSVDAGAFFMAGQRKGAGGLLQARYEF